MSLAAGTRRILQPLSGMLGRSHTLGWLFLAGSFAWAAAVSGAEQKPIPDADDPMTVVGTLTCSLMGEGKSTSAGMGRDMVCRFQPGAYGPAETYAGTVQGIGKADLLFGKGAVLLSVKAPASTAMTPGILTQSYAVDAATSGSAFAPLIGDRNKLIVLQPLAEQQGRIAQGKTQPDAVIILVELKLGSSPA